MKNFGKITGIVLLILLAGSFSLEAQRGMRGMMNDSVRMNRMKRGFDMNQGNRMNPGPDSMQMRDMRPGMGPMRMYHMQPYMLPRPGFGMRRWMAPEPWGGRMWRSFGPGWGQMEGRGMWAMPKDSTGVWQQRPGMWMFGNIPGLTDKQKKNIEELRLKQQDEMRKVRDDMMAKMKTLRESNHNKIMDLLTPEQKKWVEENRSSF